MQKSLGEREREGGRERERERERERRVNKRIVWKRGEKSRKDRGKDGERLCRPLVR